MMHALLYGIDLDGLYHIEKSCVFSIPSQNNINHCESKTSWPCKGARLSDSIFSGLWCNWQHANLSRYEVRVRLPSGPPVPVRGTVNWPERVRGQAHPSGLLT